MTDAEIEWMVTADESDQADLGQWLARLTRRPSWHTEAACRGAGTDAFIIGRGCNAAVNGRARAICAGCTVSEQCLSYALEDVDTVGIWAGTTGQQRRAMRAGKVA